MIRFQSKLPLQSPLFAFGLLLLLSTLSILASPVRSAQSADKKAVSPVGDAVTCSLQKGETELVISVPKASAGNRLTVLNQNTEAAGELTISVSNRELPAKSPDWTRVEGIISFAHKRTFDLSLLGIDAKFVKLSFRVTKTEHLAAAY